MPLEKDDGLRRLSGFAVSEFECLTAFDGFAVSEFESLRRLRV